MNLELIEFPEQTIVIAKNQPQYRPLPAFQCDDDEGKIIFCWKISFKQRIILLFTGKLWHSVMTFYKPLQPQLLMIGKPEELIIANKVKAVMEKV